MSELIKKYRRYQQEQHQKKVEKFKERNDRRMAEGKVPVTTGWNKIVDSGVGGLNKAGRVDAVGFLISEQQRIAQEKSHKK